MRPAYTPTLRKGFQYVTPEGREGTWLGVRYCESNSIELRDKYTGEKFRAELATLYHNTTDNRAHIERTKLQRMRLFA